MTTGSTARVPRQLREAGDIRRISILDLDLDQMEAIETAVGLSAKRWDEAPSQGRLLKVVYSVAFGVSLEDAGQLTMRQLRDAVDLGDGDPDQSGPGQPSA